MKEKPFIGQKVKLNNRGMKQVGGLKSAEEIQQAMNLTILGVTENMCSDIPTYFITLDQPLLSCFWLSNHEVDPR